MPERRLAQEWENRLDAALRAAADEAREAQKKALARALDEIRYYMAHSREVMIARIKELGIVTLNEGERKELFTLIADASAEKLVAEARRRSELQSATWWQRVGVKVTVAVGLVSIVITAAGVIYGVLFGFAHPYPPRP